MPELLGVSCQLSNLYALSSSMSKIKLLVDLNTRSRVEGRRSPVNLVLAVDRSASMQEAGKLEFVKEAAGFIVDKMDSGDVVSVVDFGSQVNVLVPACQVDDKQVIKNSIAQIRPKGATNMHGALSVSREQIAVYSDPSRVNRILLLSDGEATEGITEDEALRELARGMKDDGVAVTTLGVGEDYDEEILADISSVSGGNHYFIGDLQQMAGIFAEEMSRLLAIVAKEIVLEVAFSPFAVLEKLNKRYDMDLSPGVARFRLDDMEGGRHQPVMMALELKGKPAGKATLATVTVTYRDIVGTGDVITVSEEIPVEFVDSSARLREGINREVLKQWEILRGVQEAQAIVQLGKTQKLTSAQVVHQLEDIGRTMIRYNPVVAKDIMEIAEKTAKFQGVTSAVSKEAMQKTAKFQQGRY